MATLFEKLRHLLRQKMKSDKFEMNQARSSSPSSGGPHSVTVVTADNVQQLMRALEETRADQYSCAETFALLDEYVDVAVQNEEDAAALMPLVKHHLDACPGCYEEFETLLRILQTKY